jgi:hypothetical protein
MQHDYIKASTAIPPGKSDLELMDALISARRI